MPTLYPITIFGTVYLQVTSGELFFLGSYITAAIIAAIILIKTTGK